LQAVLDFEAPSPARSRALPRAGPPLSIPGFVHFHRPSGFFSPSSVPFWRAIVTPLSPSLVLLLFLSSSSARLLRCSTPLSELISTSFLGTVLVAFLFFWCAFEVLLSRRKPIPPLREEADTKMLLSYFRKLFSISLHRSPSERRPRSSREKDISP